MLELVRALTCQSLTRKGRPVKPRTRFFVTDPSIWLWAQVRATEPTSVNVVWSGPERTPVIITPIDLPERRDHLHTFAAFLCIGKLPPNVQVLGQWLAVITVDAEVIGAARFRVLEATTYTDGAKSLPIEVARGMRLDRKC